MIKNIKIPRSQKDILVKTYLKYQDYILNLSEEDKLIETKIVKNVVKIFYNLTEVQFKRLKATEVVDMSKVIDNILNTKSPLVNFIKINKVIYGLNPNFSDITFGELVDLNTEDIIKQISILYRPVTKMKRGKYQIKEYEADISTYDWMVDNLTLDVYLSFNAFFLKISQDFLVSIQKCMEEEVTLVKRIKNLVKNGVFTH